MLATLKALAQPTPEYHQHLLKVVQDTKSIDMGHLNLIVDACYYSIADIQKLEADYKTSPDWDKWKVLSTAPELVAFTSQIIENGVPKATDLNAQNGSEILKKLFTGTAAENAFSAVLKVISPIPTDQLLNFVDLAVSKSTEGVAGVVALDWFQRQPRHTVSILTEAVSHLRLTGKDILVNGALPLIPSPTALDFVAVSALAYLDSAQIIHTAINKLENLKVEDIVTLASAASKNDKDIVVASGMSRIAKFTTDEIIRLAGATYANSISVLMNFTARISDYNEGNALKLTAAVRGTNKDTEIAQYMATQGSFTTEELLELSDAAYFNATSILLDSADKLSDFTLQNMLRINNRLAGINKDALVAKYISKQKSFTTDDILVLAGVTYFNGTTVLMNNVSNISDLTVANAIAIVQKLNGKNRDSYLLSAVNLITDLSSENLSKLGDQAYSSRADIIAAGLKRLGNPP